MSAYGTGEQKPLSVRPSRIDLDINADNGTPPRGSEGYYLVWQRNSERPQCVWWSRLQTEWRDGGRVIQVAAWAGPLPWWRV